MKNYRQPQYAKGPVTALCAKMFQIPVVQQKSHLVTSEIRENRWQEILTLLLQKEIENFSFYEKDWLKRTPLMLALGNYIYDNAKQRYFFEFPGFVPGTHKFRNYEYNESREERRIRFEVVKKLLQIDFVANTIRDKDAQGNTALRYAFNIVDFFHPERQVREFYTGIMLKIYTQSSKWHKDRGFIVSNLCHFCFSSKPVYKCGACLATKYCSRECQKGFWTLFYSGQEKCCCRI